MVLQVICTGPACVRGLAELNRRRLVARAANVEEQVMADAHRAAHVVTHDEIGRVVNHVVLDGDVRRAVENHDAVVVDHVRHVTAGADLAVANRDVHLPVDRDARAGVIHDVHVLDDLPRGRVDAPDDRLACDAGRRGREIATRVRRARVEHASIEDARV